MRDAEVKAACDNCGAIGTYSMPFRSRFINYCDSEAEYYEKASHYVTFYPAERHPVNCHNCGLPKLELLYYDAKSKKPQFSQDLKFLTSYREEEDIA